MTRRMRSLRPCFAACLVLAATAAAPLAEARPRPHAATAPAAAGPKRPAAHGAHGHAATGRQALHDHADKRRLALSGHRRRAAAELVIHGPISGQSVGAPWLGRLREPAHLPDGDGYTIRRPWRAFGTRSTVDIIHQVAVAFHDDFPDAHVLAIGDISAEHGGQITEHRSHQSGRDADIGLVYKEQPPGYPENFVTATEDNLDCMATYRLLEQFAATAPNDGGVQIMFLDYDVQRMIYEWAKDDGVDEATLDRIFQYPHGRTAATGLVRHFPNHANHIHVRFSCPRGDSACR